MNVVRTAVTGPRAVVLVLATAGLVLGMAAGCKSSPQAAGSPSTSASGSPSSSPSVSGSGSARPSPRGGTSSAAPPAGGSPTVNLQTHRGTVTEGVEPSCLILRTDDGQFELVSPSKQAQTVLKPDAMVVVRGYVVKGMMSHCMQGTMFKVVSATAAN